MRRADLCASLRPVTRTVQAFLLLALMAFWVPSAGASWAYCQRSGAIHPALAGCCCEEENKGDCSDCCGEEEKDGDDCGCCVDAGKMLPEALAPVSEESVSPLSIVSGMGMIGVTVPKFRPRVIPCRAWQLRGPPPGRPAFLVLRSLRL